MSQFGTFNTGGGAGGGIDTLTGNSGGAVGPDGASNINILGDGTTITITGNPGTNTLTASSLVTPGGSVKVTTFTTNDTWTKDPDAQYIKVICVSGGSGGGSGRRGASTAAGGGGGGAPGGAAAYEAPAIFFPATETIVVGSGGAGGAAQTVNDTDGNDGIAGTYSAFGVLEATSTAVTGTPAQGGRNGAANPGFGSGSSSDFISNSSGVNSGGAGSLTNGATPLAQTVLSCATGGGGGAGANSVTERTGGSGGLIRTPSTLTTIIAGGAGGVESGVINGSNGNNGSGISGIIIFGTGGGGGGGQSVGAVAGNGGDGGFPGGGGGGGGGSLNGTNSGAGGAGADGIVYVFEWLA